MLGEGTGIIELNNGEVTGGDDALAYAGSYVVDGNKFTAFIGAEQHTPGQPSVFGTGIDVINLTLTGKFTRTTASCTGVAKQAPHLAFEATLIPIADQRRPLPRAQTHLHFANPSRIARNGRSKQ